jgi:hypothetical protein
VDDLKIKIADRKRYEFSSARLNLYLGLKGSEWLSAVNVTKEIVESFTNNTSSLRLNPLYKVIPFIQNAPPQCVHIVATFDRNLINASKRQRIEAPMQVQNRKIDFDFKKVVDINTLSLGSLCEIRGLDIAGLSSTNSVFNETDDTAKPFYCRKDTIDLVKELQTMKKGAMINGPPGVGKSTTVWLWVCNQVSKGKSALWIHLGKLDTVVHLKPSGYVETVLGLNKKKIAEYVVGATDDIVEVDGVTKETACVDIEDAMFRGL